MHMFASIRPARESLVDVSGFYEGIKHHLPNLGHVHPHNFFVDLEKDDHLPIHVLSLLTI